MSRIRLNLCRLLIGLLLPWPAGGCQSSWWKVRDLADRSSHQAEPPIASLRDDDLGLQIATASQAAKDQDLAQVLHEVDELGRTDPAAQQKLLESLQQSKPELWPLVVQQFRSSLAYHNQLVAESDSAPVAATESSLADDDDVYVWPSTPPPAVQANFQTPIAEASILPEAQPAALAATPLPATGVQAVCIEPTPVPPQPVAAEPVEPAAAAREPAALELRQLTFCKQVHGFGAYDSYDETRFSPGERVSLYVEVENYHSEATPAGFATKLGATYQILDERGECVEGGEFPDVEDACRSRRRDFHIQYGLVLPAAIEPGKYRLRLAIRDRQSDQVGQSTLDFEIGP